VQSALTITDEVPSTSMPAAVDTQSKKRFPPLFSVSANTASRMLCPALYLWTSA